MWEELYQRLYPELAAYCRRAWGPEGEDLAQETFLKALQAGDGFLDLGPAQKRAWVYRTVKNLAIDRHRRRVLEEASLPPEEDAAAEEPGYGRVETELLLSRLPEPDRTLFRLRYLEGYTARELAELYGLPAGTVRAKLSRSAKRLCKWLAPDYQGGYEKWENN